MADTLLIDEAGAWKKWPKASVLQALQQGDNRLKQLVELSKKISDRAYSLMTTCITVFILVSGWLINALTKPTEATTLLIAISIAIVVLLLITLVLLFFLIYPHDLYSAGSEPKHILYKEVLPYWDEAHFTDDEKELFLLLQECEDIQTRIEFNVRINEKRQRGITWVLRLLIAIFPVSVIIFLLLF